MKQCPICSQSFADDQTVCPSDGVRLIELHEWAAHTTVRGKYRILGKLGAGGMGVVYKAQHLILEEPRALKVMSPELARDQKFVRRFRQEAQVTRRLRHPNIVQVDDLDQADDGSLFIAMELVDGVSLRQLLERVRGPLPLARALGIARGIAEALGTAHGQGLVHRDIKPDNVLLARDGTGREIAKVLDFGIVAMKESSAHLSSHPLLTPAYAPPEQWSGMKGSELDGRADLYALGMTLYEMVTGKTAFHAETHHGWMNAHMNEEPQAPSRVNAELTPEVDRLVMRLLAKDRELRTPSAEELIKELNMVEAQSGWGLKTVVPQGHLPTVIAAAPQSPKAAGAPAPPASAPAPKPAPPPVQKPDLPKPSPPEETGDRPRRRGWGVPIGVAVLAVAGVGAWLALRPPGRPSPAASSGPTISYFMAAPTKVVKDGVVRIAWAVKDADNVRVEPAFDQGSNPSEANGGPLPLAGQKSVVVRATTSYRLIASGGGTTADATLTVEAIEKAPVTVETREPQKRRPSREAEMLARQIGVEPALTYVGSEPDYQRLMGIHSLASQDQGGGADSPGGGAAVENRDGTLFLRGNQRSREGGQATIQAMVTRVDDSSFEADGNIVLQNPAMNGGRPCVLRGKIVFRMGGDGQWHLQLPKSPCGEGGEFSLSAEPPKSGPPITGSGSEPARPAAPTTTPSAPPPSAPPPTTEKAEPVTLRPPAQGQAVRFEGTYGSANCELTLVAGRTGYFSSGTMKILSGGNPQTVRFRVAPSNDPTFITLQDERGCRLTASASLDRWGWPERLKEGQVLGACPATKWEARRVE